MVFGGRVWKVCWPDAYAVCAIEEICRIAGPTPMGSV